MLIVMIPGSNGEFELHGEKGWGGFRTSQSISQKSIIEHNRSQLRPAKGSEALATRGGFWVTGNDLERCPGPSHNGLKFCSQN